MGTGLSVASSGALGGRAEARVPHVGLHCVNVYVRDQDRSLKFYTGQLGFRVAFDAKLQSGERWVAVAPPDGSAVLALVKPKAKSQEAKLIGRGDADCFFDRRCCGAISGMVEERRAIFVSAAAEKDQVRSANTGHGRRAIAVAWHGSAGMGQRGGAFSRRGRELICAGELRRSDARDGSGTPGLGTTT